MKIALCTHYNGSFIFPTYLHRKNNFNSPLATLMLLWVDTFGVLWAYRLSWMLGGQPQDRQMWKSHITLLIMSGIKQTRLHKKKIVNSSQQLNSKHFECTKEMQTYAF